LKKLVSILIPAYNAEKWIGETINSAINQVWPNKEIIIVDDGSKDDTYNIARQYESKNVKIIRQDNKGACSARNNAFALAQGEYIQWLDADDLLAPDKISRQLEYNNGHVEPNILLSSSFGTFYYSIKRAKFTAHGLWQNLSPIDYFLLKFNEGTWMSQSVWLVSRFISERAGPWNEKIIRDNDGEYFCRVVSMSKAITFVPDAKCYYRRGNASVSGNISVKAMESLFLSRCLCIQRLLLLEDSERTRSACVNFLKSLLKIIYQKRDNPNIHDIIMKMHVMAEQLGGFLNPPEFNLKYNFINYIFGKDIAVKFKDIKWRITIGTRKNVDKFYHIFN